ncbi:tripartite tricarboxylate transporter substrate binding protein [Pigmentiphaga soli]|uniref:Tripartite tricarboxylate transporter substrate binding protein n=1 Tax=Pigmentiphaga soli TaxID=1007095 RepID=A0ABP8HJF8_9BURK
MKPPIRALAFLPAWAAAMGPALAADAYPARPVTIVVPFTPGGGSDNVARLVATKLSQQTGKTFVIENRGGAGTNIGNEYAAHAAPDGYTLLLGQFTLSVNPYLYESLRYDVDRDFTPVVQIANTPTVLVVRPDSDIKSVRDLIDKAKARAGKLNYASGGAGTPPHLSGELFRRVAGVDMVHVPYKGSGPALTDLIGGQVDLVIDTSTSILPLVKGKSLRPVAVAAGQRLAALPDVPTFAEQGLANFEVLAWYGLLAPAGTPADAVQWVNAAVGKALRDPELRGRLEDIGAIPVGGTPAQMGAFMKEQSSKWKQIIADARIKLE